MTSAVSLSALDTIEGIYPARLGDPGSPSTSAAFKTFRIPVAAFAADGRAIDLAHVVKVRLLVGRESPAGTVGLDDLEIER